MSARNRRFGAVIAYVSEHRFSMTLLACAAAFGVMLGVIFGITGLPSLGADFHASGRP